MKLFTQGFLKRKVNTLSHIGLLLICTLMIFGTSWAQLPNKPFEDRVVWEDKDSVKISFNFRTLGFTKNNEYFNRIADGYTLFGTQFNPYFSYQPIPSFRFDAGFYMRQDYGTKGLQVFEPTFTFRVKHEGYNLLIGNLDGAMNHRLIDPMLDFERVLTNRLEQGVQLFKVTDGLFLDLWVDWETMIYRGDAKQEEVYGGFSIAKKWEIGSGLLLSIPLQGVIYHKGGAIDNHPGPLQTMINLAGGLRIEEGDRQGITWGGSAYYAWFNDFSISRLLDYKDGRGWYFNVEANLNKGLKLMVSYWAGNEFISLLGGPVYESVSSSYKKPYFSVPERSLVFIRFFHDITLGDGIVLSSRFEPFYDFQRKRVEFSHGLYLNFRGRLPVKGGER
ncbi:MAG: hypothetical protein OEX02_05370 [Cyclobacteriaceae bacterium]|nr:hypothetical protein [Cyclobacteriaceae bacterium]